MKEEEFQQKYAEYTILKTQIESLIQELNAMGGVEMELLAAKNTIESLKGAKDSEIMVPLGGNSFVMADLKDKGYVLTGVGAGVVVEKKVSDAVESIGTQLETLTDGRAKLEGQIKKMGERLGALEPELQAYLQTMQAKKK
ncbi:MAG: prefoldin subunit alpha [archaeon]